MPSRVQEVKPKPKTTLKSKALKGEERVRQVQKVKVTTPKAAATAQRVTRSQSRLKALETTPATSPGGTVKRTGDVGAILRRFRDRAAKRERIATGRYQTSTGPVSISGLNKQRMSQARKADYGDKTFGGLPDYDQIRSNLPRSAFKAIYDPSYKPPNDATDEQKLATSLTTSLLNVSEPDRAKGIDKPMRARARHALAKPTSTHLLDPDSNPLVGAKGPERGRKIMSGEEAPHADLKDSILNYASDSSGDDAEPGAIRERKNKRALLTPFEDE
jgi:hypothetical protein